MTKTRKILKLDLYHLISFTLRIQYMFNSLHFKILLLMSPDIFFLQQKTFWIPSYFELRYQFYQKIWIKLIQVLLSNQSFIHQNKLWFQDLIVLHHYWLTFQGRALILQSLHKGILGSCENRRPNMLKAIQSKFQNLHWPLKNHLWMYNIWLSCSFSKSPKW